MLTISSKLPQMPSSTIGYDQTSPCSFDFRLSHSMPIWFISTNFIPNIWKVIGTFLCMDHWLWCCCLQPCKGIYNPGISLRTLNIETWHHFMLMKSWQSAVSQRLAEGLVHGMCGLKVLKEALPCEAPCEQKLYKWGYIEGLWERNAVLKVNLWDRWYVVLVWTVHILRQYIHDCRMYYYFREGGIILPMGRKRKNFKRREASEHKF